MNKSFTLILSFIIFPFCILHKICSAASTSIYIVQDTEKDSSIVKNWRDSFMLAAASQHNNAGLSNLWLSGSGAPSAQGFKTIKHNIQTATQNKIQHIIDVDLRQETHFYLNHNSINITIKDNAINFGKTDDEIIHAEKKWLQKLRAKPIIHNVLSAKNYKNNNFSAAASVPIVSLVTERELATAQGFEYVRFNVTDHQFPRDNDVDAFVLFVNNLQPNSWLHFHCRGGSGRTTTFMAMYDMLKNANKVSFKDILNRQASVSPFYNLFEVNRKKISYGTHYKKRLDFLKKFYQYSQQRLRGDKRNWSVWLKDLTLS